MPTFHTYTYTIYEAKTPGNPRREREVIAEGILIQDLDNAVGQCVAGYVCGQGIPITIEQVHTAVQEEIPEGGIR